MMEANENDNSKSNKKNIPISSLKNNKFKNLTAEQIIKKYEDVLFSREKQFYELSNEIGKLTQKIQFLVQKKEKSKYNNNILNDIFSKKQQLLKQELSNKEIVFMKLTDLEHKYDDLQNKIDDIINKQNALAESSMREKEKSNQDREEYYTKEEIKRLDKFQAQTENKFDDAEIYELMLKYKNDDDAILKELKDRLNEMRGEGESQDIGKRN